MRGRFSFWRSGERQRFDYELTETIRKKWDLPEELSRESHFERTALGDDAVYERVPGLTPPNRIHRKDQYPLLHVSFFQKLAWMLKQESWRAKTDAGNMVRNSDGTWQSEKSEPRSGRRIVAQFDSQQRAVRYRIFSADSLLLTDYAVEYENPQWDLPSRLTTASNQYIGSTVVFSAQTEYVIDVDSISDDEPAAELFTLEGMGADLIAEGSVDYRSGEPVVTAAWTDTQGRNLDALRRIQAGEPGPVRQVSPSPTLPAASTFSGTASTPTLPLHPSSAHGAPRPTREHRGGAPVVLLSAAGLILSAAGIAMLLRRRSP